MDPPRADLHALVALAARRRSDGRHDVNSGQVSLCIDVLLLFLQRLMYEGDRDGALGYC
jgi:hypothetical protein